MLVLALQFSRATSDLWMDPGSTRGHRRHRSAVPATSSSARPSEASHHTNSVMRVAPSKRNSDVRQLRVPVVPARAAEAEGRGRDESVAPTNQCSTWELPESETNPDSSSVLLRKEVIQPHLPVRLPCYDFTPIADPTFDGSLPEGWATGFGCYQLSWCDGRCVQGPGTYSPQQC